jgi:hypothetical protein
LSKLNYFVAQQELAAINIRVQTGLGSRGKRIIRENNLEKNGLSKMGNCLSHQSEKNQFGKMLLNVT